MANRRLAVGFIGSGYIARQHAGALRLIEEVHFSACTDVDPTRAQELADLSGARPTDDIREVIECSDAVWVCTPPKAHRDQVIDCLDAGIHVYCEKPLAATAEDGRAIAEKAQRSEALAAIGFNYRFHGPWQKCRALLDAGELGKPMMFLCQRIGAGATSGWRRDPDQLCGMTIESVSHNVDLIRFLLGDISSVSARTAAADAHQPQFDNCLVATLRLRSGAIAGIQATWASPAPATRHGIIGTEATALVEGPSQFEFDRLRYARREGEAEQLFHFPLPANPLQMACEHFVAAIRGEVALELPIEGGARALDVCEAMVASAQADGATISLE
jgi:myo-inositol 2-dehydrogenase/D-chiro-inositol 1-dehydrogenase